MIFTILALYSKYLQIMLDIIQKKFKVGNLQIRLNKSSTAIFCDTQAQNREINYKRN